MAYKQDWLKDASYEYWSWEKGGNKITFKFPNAYPKPLEWETWVYKYEPGAGEFDEWVKVDTNYSATILQCYMDAIGDGHITVKEQS